MEHSARLSRTCPVEEHNVRTDQCKHMLLAAGQSKGKGLVESAIGTRQEGQRPHRQCGAAVGLAPTFGSRAAAAAASLAAAASESAAAALMSASAGLAGGLGGTPDRACSVRRGVDRVQQGGKEPREGEGGG